MIGWSEGMRQSPFHFGENHDKMKSEEGLDIFLISWAVSKQKMSKFEEANGVLRK